MTTTQSYNAETLAALENSHDELLRAAKLAIGAAQPACGELQYVINASAFDRLLEAVMQAGKVRS